MRPGNLSPDTAVVATVLLCLSLVDVSHPLSLVPVYLLLSVNSFDLDEGRVWILVGLRPFVSEDGSPHVESAKLDNIKRIRLSHYR